jgi:hypothetical protein
MYIAMRKRVVMLYIVTIATLVAIYFIAILFIGRIKNTKVVNVFLFTIIFGLYVFYVLINLFRYGSNSPYFHGVLATANISSFMFSVLPIIYFSNLGRQRLYFLVSLLSVGMLLSPVFNAVTYAVCNYPFDILPILDYICHLLFSLWGIYLAKSRQIEVNKKEAFLSSLIIIFVAVFMIILNCIFDTSFFGLSLTGKHNIYGHIIVQSSWLSAIIYFVGLTIVLCVGYIFIKCFSRRKKD